MYGSSAVVRRATVVLTLCALVVAFTCISAAFAQTPHLYTAVGNVSGFVTQRVSIPITFQTLADSLDGFEYLLSLSRDDLIYFEVDTVVVGTDTSWVAEVDTVGTYTSGWQHIQGRCTAGKGLDLRVSGISDVGTGTTPGIPDYTSGVLIKFYARILSTIPDTLSDRIVSLNVLSGSSWFSNEHGLLIQPVQNQDGSVTVAPCGGKGDVDCNGTRNPTDVVKLVNYVYKGMQQFCQLSLGDLNCSRTVNPTDVVRLVNYVYKGIPIPPC